ncbi:F0F1 ATP synthase subunit epsilon [Candidatus Formimonas warabiya]|uniref:ATP synthase epsilon chain n=1 Tax=Formimonas warabiya TaxID=1761012 RepID=A0A3G1KU53_FORW1|nr:F0F1 ATP synthase subunit epsilon [Candidatus Formimonas warabiya]ATW25976.1 ATP synthase F1 subunit epsilon [Candidatus Formimonas warabiya]
MADNPITFDVVTPEKIIFSGAIESVIVPGALGYLEVLRGHAPLVTALDVGVVTIKQDGKEKKMAISGGFMEVIQNKVTVLADTAELGEKIDVTRAEEAKDRAERRLTEHAADLDVLRAEMALKRAISRIRAAK